MAAYCTTALHTLYRPIRVAYPGRSENRIAACVRYAKAHWTKIGVAVLSGVFAGFLTGAVTSRTEAPPDRALYAATEPAHLGTKALAAPVKLASPDNTRELSRLRAENQELQALVETLRQHPASTRAHRAKGHRRRHGRAG